MVEPEITRAKAKLHVERCNSIVHQAPWTTGRIKGFGAGGLFEALELAEQAYAAHGLPYKRGLPNMEQYDPRRFRWIYDQQGEADNCVKLLDTQTNKTVIWLRW
jgi:hypothetical protein